MGANDGNSTSNGDVRRSGVSFVAGAAGGGWKLEGCGEFVGYGGLDTCGD